MKIRHALPDDVSAITDVVMASLAKDDSWKALFPPGFRRDPTYDQYAKEIVKRHVAADNTDWLVLVVDVSDPAAPASPTCIASVAIWDMSHSRFHASWRKSKTSDIDDLIPVMYPDTSDAVLDRLTALSSAISYSQKQHFERFEPYVFLEVLATHPRHRGKGYAKALCAMGASSAGKRDMSIAALTSARGYIFFSGQEFKDLGCFCLRGETRTEDCVLKAMVLHTPKKRAQMQQQELQRQRRGSSVIGSFLSYISQNGATAKSQ